MAEQIAIIGAGMAGLSCAQVLTREGYDVRLFDKGRGPGGRMSTRRAETSLGELRWDHGAQYFTARSQAFGAAVAEWEAAGAVAEWTGRFVRVGSDGQIRADDTRRRLVGVPGMNDVIRHMASPLRIEWAARVKGISGRPGDYRLVFEDGAEAGPFAKFVIAVPAEQVPDLVGELAPELAGIARVARSAPCWTVMLAFDETFESPFDAARIETGPLSWIARNVSKPGRGTGETWVLQAGPAWSQTHIEDTPETVIAELGAHFSQIVPAGEPVHTGAHRWRFARVEQPAPAEDELSAAARGIFACGDWARSARVEAAWLSGRRAAGRVADKQMSS